MHFCDVKKTIENQLPHKIDYLLVCASYEDRCLSMYEYIDPKRINTMALFYFKQFEDSVSANLDLYRNKFTPSIFELDYAKSTTIADALIDLFAGLDESSGKPNVVIDISTFTRESLLIVLRFLEINKAFLGDVHCFYRCADVAEVLSNGIVQIRSVIGYIGDINPNKPLHLIVLSGFEHDRAKEIIDTLEPDRISIGFGGKSGSISSKLFKMNKNFTNILLANYSTELIDEFEHSLIDPEQTSTTLDSIIKKYPEHNVVIAPLNNKISTVGAGLAAIRHPNVQICYSQMAEYNVEQYSSATESCHVFKIDFMGTPAEN
ncbi:hypothetical protein CMT41_11575 [Colwellia sp. MT41]|nr:hypothetical protein CMT41_11575 [Colwellia sp. MT41]